MEEREKERDRFDTKVEEMETKQEVTEKEREGPAIKFNYMGLILL